MKVDPTYVYEGLEVYKKVNKNVEYRLSFFKEQIKYNERYPGETIINMLNSLEKSLKLELED